MGHFNCPFFFSLLSHRQRSREEIKTTVEKCLDRFEESVDKWRRRLAEGALPGRAIIRAEARIKSTYTSLYEAKNPEPKIIHALTTSIEGESASTLHAFAFNVSPKLSSVRESSRFWQI